MATKKSPKKSKKVDVLVDRKFLTNLANSIYNPKNKTFLRLCNGKLQNGPDPTNAKRPMHCGLGELYFAMTGLQPEATNVSEEGVVNLAVELSPLNGLVDVAKEKAKKAIEASDMHDDIKSILRDVVDNIDEEELTTEENFREALDRIPGVNDDGCEDGKCSITAYRNRSKRVAEQLRKAAGFLPE